MRLFPLQFHRRNSSKSAGWSPMCSLRASMIQVTRLNRTQVVLNSDLIEEIETTPDTVISLTTGQKIMVLESTEEIVERIRRYRRSLMAGLAPEAQCLSS